jgi:hypothetical protein
MYQKNIIKIKRKEKLEVKIEIKILPVTVRFLKRVLSLERPHYAIEKYDNEMDFLCVLYSM